MTHRIHIRPATVDDADDIARMAVSLTQEISLRLGAAHFDLDLHNTAALCTALLAEGRYLAFIAERDGVRIGFAGLSEGCSLYAEGRFATLQEFHVEPTWRSAGVGAALLEAAVALTRARGWRRLEVCTPPLPAFERSLAFYERHGFEVTGGRKLRLVV